MSGLGGGQGTNERQVEGQVGGTGGRTWGTFIR